MTSANKKCPSSAKNAKKRNRREKTPRSNELQDTSRLHPCLQQKIALKQQQKGSKEQSSTSLESNIKPS